MSTRKPAGIPDSLFHAPPAPEPLFQIAHAIVLDKKQTNIPSFWRQFFSFMIPLDIPEWQFTLKLKLTRMEIDQTRRFGHINYVEPGHILLAQTGIKMVVTEVDKTSWDLTVYTLSTIIEVSGDPASLRLTLIRIVGQTMLYKD